MPVGGTMYRRHKVRHNSLNAITPSFRTRRHVHFGVCAPQSASFALATTHSPDVLLNASRPTTRIGTILYNIIRRSRGDNRHSHRKVSSPYYATRSPIKRTTLIGSLVLIVKFGTPPLVALRLEAPNKHIPLISTLRTSFRSGVGVPPI